MDSASILADKVKMKKQSREATSLERATAKATNLVYKVMNCSYEATVVLKGNFDVNLLDEINLTIYCKDGTMHFASGVYLVVEKVDVIEGDFTTTLKLEKISAPTEAAASIGYKNYTYSAITTKVQIDGSDAPYIEGEGMGAAVAEFACQFEGNPYVWGGTDLENGCDCSGFAQQVFKHFGVDIPRHSSAQRNAGIAVPLEEIQAGDLVCYDGHVGIYVGGGQMINASNSKPYPKGGIKYTNIYYKTILAVRRIV